MKLRMRGTGVRVVILFATVLLSGAGISGDVYPLPGVSFLPWIDLPTDKHGAVLLDLGLPTSGRPSLYGLGVGVFCSAYEEMMVGAHAGFITVARTAYGAQFGFFNTVGKGGGVQVGAWNVYNDESFRVQVGLLNSPLLSLDWKHDSGDAPGGSGVQVGLANVSYYDGHFQAGLFNLSGSSVAFQTGLFNLAESPMAFQVGLYNFASSPHCIQVGLINMREGITTPLIGWRW